MLTNKDLTRKEFDVAMKIKLAMSCLHNENTSGIQEYLTDAMQVIYRE